MSSELSADEQSLRQEVEQSERELDKLESDLHAVDTEIESLAQQKHRYDLLSDICRSLKELDNIGAADLFWEEHSATDDQAARLQYAQDKIDGFCEEFTKLEERRNVIIDKIGDQNYELDVLHYDLQDVIEREESKQNEWLVERDADELPYRAQVMPWARGGEEDQRFRKSVGSSLAASLAIALILSMVALPVIDKATKP